jgi:hypothetical protein
MVLILLSFLSLMAAVYICSHFTGSGSDIVIIPLTNDSYLYMFSFKEVVLILLSFLSLMTAVYICSLLQEVVLTIWESLPVKENIYTQLPSVRGMITIWEPLLVKENIYTQLTSVRGMITISEQLPVKGEHIYTAVIIERNDNNIRTTFFKRTYIHSCHQWEEW